MPDFPIVDAHVHLWDPARMSISWQQENDFLRRSFLPQNYAKDLGHVDVEAMVFVECFVDQGNYLREVQFVEKCAKKEPRIKSIVAQAPLEFGDDVRPFLQYLKNHHPKVVGIRRMIEFQDDPDFCLRPNFIKGLNMLAEFDYSFEINIHHSQMDKVLQMVPKIDGVTMILDHCGKPGIKEQSLQHWKDQMAELASHENVYCKLSDLPVEADWENWDAQDISPYIDVTVEAFTLNRMIYAGDWPVCLQATSLTQWVSLLDAYFQGVDEKLMRAFYNGNAKRVYKIT